MKAIVEWEFIGEFEGRVVFQALDKMMDVVLGIEDCEDIVHISSVEYRIGLSVLSHKVVFYLRHVEIGKCASQRRTHRDTVCLNVRLIIELEGSFSSADIKQ